ncbi:MAG: hypothetical protein ACTSUK_07810 [Promethearchaeota archaeon]
MPITMIHSFLVHPSKHEQEQPEIGGTEIPMSGGSLYNMLSRVFNRAPDECNIDIIFRPDEEGNQRNECRDLLVAYAQNPNIENGRLIAQKLQQVTTHRSGLGLLFLMKGIVDVNHHLVISRFPATQGIIAEEDATNLRVEFIERIFMKSSKAYKSALYRSDSLERGFWDGVAIDLQTSEHRELSDYWIREFLQSELRTTGRAGTKRFAVALRNAIRSATSLNVRQELISTANLLRGRNGQRISARQIINQIGLSQDAIEALEHAFIRPDLMEEYFQFDLEEFHKHAAYRSIELDTGGLLIAEDSRFNEVFKRYEINAEEGRFRYETEGVIIDEKLRKNK